MSPVSSRTPEGNPSTIAVKAGPCDSPAVRYRSMAFASLVEWLFPRKRLAGQYLKRLDILASRLLDDIFGQPRRHARLVPACGLEPVADELLVKRRLRAAWPIRLDRPVS